MNSKRFIGVMLASSVMASCGGNSSPDTTTGADETGSDLESSTETVIETSSTRQPASEEALTDAVDPGVPDQERADPNQDALSDIEVLPEDDFEVIIAGLTGDAVSGRRIFARCASCHVLEEGINRAGPSLYGVIGREAGAIDNYRYSQANQTIGVIWTEDTLFDYLENPRAFMPGTNMAFAGVRNPQDRVNLIAYIKANGGAGG